MTNINFGPGVEIKADTGLIGSLNSETRSSVFQWQLVCLLVVQAKVYRKLKVSSVIFIIIIINIYIFHIYIYTKLCTLTSLSIFNLFDI